MQYIVRHLRKYIFACVLAILFLGGVAEYHWEKDHFQRSGSVVVFFAFLVVLFSSYIRGMRDTQEREAILKSTVAVVEARMAGRSLKNSNLQSIISNAALETYEPNSKFIALDKYLGKLDVTQIIVAAIGTIVWGYGDLLVKLL